MKESPIVDANPAILQPKVKKAKKAKKAKKPHKPSPEEKEVDKVE